MSIDTNLKPSRAANFFPVGETARDTYKRTNTRQTRLDHSASQRQTILRDDIEGSSLTLIRRMATLEQK